MVLKGNRLVALGEAESAGGLGWSRPEERTLHRARPATVARTKSRHGPGWRGWISHRACPASLYKQGRPSGILYLVCSKWEAGWDAITTTYY